MLYVVSTPIGNLGDVTARAIETLRSVDIVAAEDTRVTRKLLSHFGIKTHLVSYHEHSGPAATDELVRRMAEAGQSVALVTDAGTPGVSGPGTELVAAAIAAGVRVVPIPGPSALLASLAGSGLPSARFVFEGFLPRTKGPRARKLLALSAEERTLIFYESPERIAATISDVADAFGGDRPACVARELTKIFEEFQRGDLRSLSEHYGREKTRGECVLIVGGAPAGRSRTPTANFAADGRQAGRAKELMRLLSAETGIARRELYRAVAELKSERVRLD